MNDREGMGRLLLEGTRELGLELDSDRIAQFLDYLELVQEWNEKINLTAILDEKEFIIKHFIDSLAGVLLMEDRGRLADIGSGAGLPGLALKLFYPELEICLVESVGKKAQFLEKTAQVLALKDVQVLCSRAEDLGKDSLYRESFDFVVCRAVSQLAVVAEYCLPLVKTGGCFIAYKGDRAEEELSRAEKAVATLGGTLEPVYKVTLPFLGDKRTLIPIRKTGTCPEKYPRRAGIPAKRPLI